MVVLNSMSKSRALMKARLARRRGFKAQVFKKKRGYGTSIKRK